MVKINGKLIKGGRMAYGHEDGSGWAGGLDPRRYTPREIRLLINDLAEQGIQAVEGTHYPTLAQIEIAKAFYASLADMSDNELGE